MHSVFLTHNNIFIFMIKDKIRKFFSISPCSIMLAGVLSGILPLLFSISFYLSGSVFLLISFIIFFITSSSKTLFKYILWTGAGVLAFYGSGTYSANNEALKYLKSEAFVSLSFNALDNSLSASEETSLTYPRNIFVNSISLTSLSSDKEHIFSQKIYMRIPKNSSELLFGRSYKAEGELIPVDRIYSGYFLNYLKSMGAFYVFIPETINPLIKTPSLKIKILTLLMKTRDSLFNRCMDGIQNEQVKGFLSGVFFGLRHGIDYNLKKQFIQTGTIHIIVISGAHIAILALLLFIILSPLPIRMRYAALPLCLLIYLIALGYPQSAMRAFIMISVFMLLKYLLRISDKFNILFFTCSIMLLFNPYSLCNPGFIYSYTVVFFLLAGWNCSKAIKSTTLEKYLWIPKQHLGYSVKKSKIFKEKIILLAASSVIAAAAALPLQLIFNNLMTPTVPFISILILPLLFPLFIAVFFKVLFWQLIQWFIISDLVDSIISGIVNLIFYIIEAGADANLSFYVQTPSILLLIIFYALFMGALIFFNRHKITFILLSCLVLLSVYVGTVGIFSKNTAISVTPPGSSYSSYIFTFPSASSALIINCPENSAYEIDGLLKTNGINRISKIILTKSSKDLSGDTVRLLRLYSGRIGSIETLGSIRKSKTLTNIQSFAEKAEIPFKMNDKEKNDSGCSFYSEGNLVSIKNDAQNFSVEINKKQFKFENTRKSISSEPVISYFKL